MTVPTAGLAMTASLPPGANAVTGRPARRDGPAGVSREQPTSSGTRPGSSRRRRNRLLAAAPDRERVEQQFDGGPPAVRALAPVLGDTDPSGRRWPRSPRSSPIATSNAKYMRATA